jgi:hypothetical protein
VCRLTGEFKLIESDLHQQDFENQKLFLSRALSDKADKSLGTDCGPKLILWCSRSLTFTGSSLIFNASSLQPKAYSSQPKG